MFGGVASRPSSTSSHPLRWKRTSNCDDYSWHAECIFTQRRGVRSRDMESTAHRGKDPGMEGDTESSRDIGMSRTLWRLPSYTEWFTADTATTIAVAPTAPLLTMGLVVRPREITRASRSRRSARASRRGTRRNSRRRSRRGCRRADARRNTRCESWRA